VSRIDVQRRRHRYSRPGGQATADEESACETAGSPRATIGLATAAKSKKRVNRTPGPALVRIIARVALRPSSGRELRLAAYVILGEVGSIFIFRDLIGRLFFLH
jgi:hypothetical protein